METLFFVSLWLTSIPHTFMGFTRSDLRNPRSVTLALSLFLLIFGSLFLLSSRLDITLIFMIYFFWQQYHYSRQTYGIYRLKNPNEPKSRWDSAFYVCTTLICVLGSLSDGPQFFFGYAIRNPLIISLNETTTLLLGIFFLVTYLGIRRPAQTWRPILHTLLNFAALLWMKNFMLGWLILNVFHNLQYFKIMFDFEKNTKALIVPFGLTLVFYGAQSFYPASEPIWVLFLALNFTHYIWDSRIWKSSLKRVTVG